MLPNIFLSDTNAFEQVLVSSNCQSIWMLGTFMHFCTMLIYICFFCVFFVDFLHVNKSSSQKKNKIIQCLINVDPKIKHFAMYFKKNYQP